MPNESTPTMLDKGLLLAARWLVEQDQPTLAGNMLRDHGLGNLDCSQMEEGDQMALASLNKEYGIRLKICLADDGVK